MMMMMFMWRPDIFQACHIEHLKDFVNYLTQAMHSRLAHSQVIWYDSVTDTGKLKWQDQLNAANQCFFDKCDGIFLNYCWTTEKLMSSCQVAPSGRQNDIYVGCDVFGRGCLGGGKFDTCVVGWAKLIDFWFKFYRCFEFCFALIKFF